MLLPLLPSLSTMQFTITLIINKPKGNNNKNNSQICTVRPNSYKTKDEIQLSENRRGRRDSQNKRKQKRTKKNVGKISLRPFRYNDYGRLDSETAAGRGAIITI